MSQSNTGVVLRSGAETTLRYLEAKRKNRKTLTLKKSPKKQNHFEPSADFTDSGVLNAGLENNVSPGGDVISDSSFSNVVPILTSAVAPVLASATTQGVSVDDIPVLENPVPPSKGKPNVVNNRMVATVFLAVIALGMLVFGGTNQQREIPETLSTTTIGTVTDDLQTLAGSDNALSDNALNKLANDNNAANVSSTNKKIDISLVQNIVELVQAEQFSKDTTLEALLSIWQQTDASTRATLNSTPWFLRFVFSLQKRAKLYLQSPESYYADYNIKFNGLLNLAIALGVMDHQGIKSSAESYHVKQNELVERLKSEIATIESSAKAAQPTADSIASLNKTFREQYAAEPGNAGTRKQVVARKVTEKTMAPVLVTPVVATEAVAVETVSLIETIETEKSIAPIELDAIVTRFIAAYEHGDLDILMSLFSPTARTNDKNNWQGIRQDYKNLFGASSFRLLNIVNLTWSSTNNAMKGTGDYEIAIAMDEAGNARTLHGKIQFVVGKVDNQLRITRLYHLER
jgi:hypothetical protein